MRKKARAPQPAQDQPVQGPPRLAVMLVEPLEGAFREFQVDAVSFWCDAGPVIRAAQDDVLAALG